MKMLGTIKTVGINTNKQMTMFGTFKTYQDKYE